MINFFNGCPLYFVFLFVLFYCFKLHLEMRARFLANKTGLPPPPPPQKPMSWCCCQVQLLILPSFKSYNVISALIAVFHISSSSENGRNKGDSPPHSCSSNANPCIISQLRKRSGYAKNANKSEKGGQEESEKSEKTETTSAAKKQSSTGTESAEFE